MEFGGHAARDLPVANGRLSAGGRVLDSAVDLVDTTDMSVVSSPLDTSLVQAAQAQQTASKARDRERAASDRAQRFADLVELRVAGVESAEAVRRLPQSDSEQADAEREAAHQPAPNDNDEARSRIDVTA